MIRSIAFVFMDFVKTGESLHPQDTAIFEFQQRKISVVTFSSIVSGHRGVQVHACGISCSLAM